MRFATSQDVLGCDKPTGIERAADLGFDGVELVVPDGIHRVDEADGMVLDLDGIDPYADDLWTPEGRARVRGVADRHGIELPSVCPSYFNCRPGLASPDEDERAAVAADLEGLIDVAADLGADTILVPFFYEAEIEDEADRERVVTAVRDLAPDAEAAGVTLALETSRPPEEDRAMLDAIDSPAVGIYYDVGNSTWFGYDPEIEFELVGESIAMMHVKDSVGSSGDAMLGAGEVDFAGFADALATLGYEGWLVLETVHESDPAADAGRNLQFLREAVE
ncbi:MAG: sugar phosphate isomerase/epimerase family protein [Haloarculaceae archaeon]